MYKLSDTFSSFISVAYITKIITLHKLLAGFYISKRNMREIVIYHYVNDHKESKILSLRLKQIFCR